MRAASSESAENENQTTEIQSEDTDLRKPDTAQSANGKLWIVYNQNETVYLESEGAMHLSLQCSTVWSTYNQVRALVVIAVAGD